MDFGSEKQKQIAKWVIGIATACILIYLGVRHIDAVVGTVLWVIGLITPLLLGFVLALILNVPMRFFESHLWRKTKKTGLRKLRRPVSFLFSIILIFGILAGVIWLVIPELVDAVTLIVHSIIDLINKVSQMDEAALAEIPFGNLLIDIEWDKLIASLQTWLKEQSGNIMNTAVGTISSVISWVVNIFIAFVFSIYILFNKEKLKRQLSRLIRAWLPKGFGEWLIHALSVASGNFRNFVSGQTLEAIILGTLCMIGMLILQIPYAPMVGALVMVTALIPVVGGFIGTIVGAFMILTVSPIKAVIFVVFLVVLQQLEGNLIYPKVMGSRVNLPAMWILAAVTVGGGLAGPIGMLLGVPVASTIYVLVKEATEKREKKPVKSVLPADSKEDHDPPEEG